MIYWDKLKDLVLKNRLLTSLSIFMLLINMILSLALFESKKNITVTQIPYLQQPISHKVDFVPQEAVFNFAALVWQQVNNWPESGLDDYKNNIQKYGGYLDDEFREMLHKNYTQLKEDGKLRRTREAYVLADNHYMENTVKQISPNLWSVVLKMKVKEYSDSTLIKDVFVTYPLYVRKTELNNNNFGLVIAGLSDSAWRQADE